MTLVFLLGTQRGIDIKPFRITQNSDIVYAPDMMLFSYIRSHKIVWLIFAALFCLSAWNYVSNTVPLETCNSPINPVENLACGNMSEYYDRGDLRDSAADIFLIPTRMLFIPLSRIRSVYQLSHFELSFTSLDNTLFIPTASRTASQVIDIVLLLVQSAYLIGLSTFIHWLWTAGRRWDMTIRIATRAAILLLIYIWIIPFPFSFLLPLSPLGLLR